MCNQDQQSCEGEEFVITMAIGQKTRSGESLCHGDYHVNGPNTLLRIISFLHGNYHDYHCNWTENWERGRFLPWWLPWQWAKHGFKVDGFLPWWLPWQWDRKLEAGKVFAMVITMAVGKTRFWLMGFCHGDYHGSGTQNWERGRFLPWWLPWQWAKHGFEVDGFLPWWLPWQWDRKLGAGKVFAMVITMAVGKTQFWGWWVFAMVITMAVGHEKIRGGGFCHGD